MVELTAKQPFAAMLPVRIGKLELSAADLGEMTLLMPFDGQEGAVSAALRAAHGIEAPAGLSSSVEGDVRAIWFGQGQIMLMGAPAPEGLGDMCALSDQSDAWACATLSGAQSEDVLARLVPVDTRLSAFPVGSAVRSVIAHMNGAVLRVGEDQFVLMVFRSMAATLVHDVKDAMEMVTARECGE